MAKPATVDTRIGDATVDTAIAGVDADAIDTGDGDRRDVTDVLSLFGAPIVDGAPAGGGIVKNEEDALGGADVEVDEDTVSGEHGDNGVNGDNENGDIHDRDVVDDDDIPLDNDDDELPVMDATVLLSDSNVLVDVLRGYIVAAVDGAGHAKNDGRSPPLSPLPLPFGFVL